jgi:hypothetical protein
MRNTIPHVCVAVKSPFCRIEFLNKPFADWMGVEVAMPGRFNREPEFGPTELE